MTTNEHSVLRAILHGKINKARRKHGTTQTGRMMLVCRWRAETQRQSVAVFASTVHVDRFFTTLCTIVNDHKSTRSMGLGVTNKLQQVDKFTNNGSASNERQV